MLRRLGPILLSVVKKKKKKTLSKSWLNPDSTPGDPKATFLYGQALNRWIAKYIKWTMLL